jgi:serine/threonine-protein kinase
VFLTQREEGGLLVKVVDFGISKLLRDDPSLAPGEQKNLTRMGTALGTPQYMSPEQAQGNTNVDHRTDVWALGCLLYEMLAGKTPYEDAGTYEMTIVRILTTRPQPLLAVAPWVPPQLAQVIDSALVHEWAQRMPDAATFVRMMNEALQLEPQHTGRQSAVQVQPYALPRSSSVDVRAVSLGATLPMSGEHESMVAAARAQLSSGPYVQPQPIIAHSGSHTAVSVDEAPVAGRAGSAILFVGLGALVVALGVGGWVLFGRGEDRKPVPASKPVETAAVESAKNKTEEPPPAPEKKPDPAPSASASASSKPVKDASPIKSGKLPTGKASAVATASAAGSSTGAKTGSGFGGAGVSESY